MITTAEINRKASVAQELASILAPQITLHAGDFDEWLRDDDPDNVGYAYELIISLAGAQALTRSQIEHRLEAVWTDLYKDMAEEYAQAVSWDRERGIGRYADRRGA